MDGGHADPALRRVSREGSQDNGCVHAGYNLTGLDPLVIVAKLPVVKPNPKVSVTKRVTGRKPAMAARGRKTRVGGGFAPELCGIITGPTDLSLREGFGRG